MVEMKLTRRDFIKSNAVAAAAATAGITVPGLATAQQKNMAEPSTGRASLASHSCVQWMAALWVR